MLPNYTTVHRRFQQWCERAVRREMLTQLANTWRAEGEIDEREGEQATRRHGKQLERLGHHVILEPVA